MRRLVTLYSGRVQGVGFRATVARLARDLPVTGRVCNLTDGRVELIAEGSQETLDELRTRVAEEMARNIVDEQITWGAATGSWSDFAVGPDKHL